MFSAEDKFLPYLKFAPLLSNNTIEVSGGTGIELTSKEEFGKNTKQYLNTEFHLSEHIPDEAREEIECNAPEFLRDIRNLHNKFAHVVADNSFLSVALDFFYDANNTSVFTDEGFICAVICLEALFNEGTSDIRYKIAHRAAFLMGLVETNGTEIFENLKHIYRYRNSLLHGQGASGRNPGSSTYKVERYARRSLIIFLILLRQKRRNTVARKYRKLELLKEIDHAMLDTTKAERLRKEIERGMGAFQLSVPRTYGGKEESGRPYRIRAW